MGELKEFLEAFGLPTSGAQSELVARLETATVAKHVDRVAALAVRTTLGAAVEENEADGDVQVVKEVTAADRTAAARRAAVNIEDENEVNEEAGGATATTSASAPAAAAQPSNPAAAVHPAWPPKLRAYVERAFAQCVTETQR
jgi:hypothetical protein|eukprot:COSAG06_NODE_3365_length_5449_cov_2.510280_8_plen_143_part_00